MRINARKVLYWIPLTIGLVFFLNLFFVGTRKNPPVNQLIISSIGDASFLNPVLAQDSASSEINGFVFNGLLKYDKDLILVGDLAESWEVKEGPRPEITFTLRPGVRWHDGRPFSAEDVRFTYQTIMDEKTNTVRRSDYELVDRLEVLDARHLRVIYKEPFSPGLSSWTMGIIPRHLLAGADINTTPFNRRPVGTGPFRFAEWVSDEKIALTANPDYFEGRPLLDRIIYRIIPETSLSEIELLTGGSTFFNTYPHQYQRMSPGPTADPLPLPRPGLYLYRLQPEFISFSGPSGASGPDHGHQSGGDDDLYSFRSRSGRLPAPSPATSGTPIRKWPPGPSIPTGPAAI